ncbi:MAG: nuclear transport factor 2 family protein [Candidatus Solibacter sp.]
MKALILPLLLCAGLPAQDIAPAVRDRIEKAVLEVNAQMTAASEDLDIDRLFSYVLPNERGSIVLNGKLYVTREEALAAVKSAARGGATVKYAWKKLLVTVISPSTALLVAEGESVIRPDSDSEHPVVTPFVQSLLFVLADGKWKALHAHQTAQR